MPELIVFSGLPGSGKSTFAKELKGYKVHSSDDLRKELFGDENCQDKNSELFDELHKRIITDLKSDSDVVFDATNISYKTRMSFLEKIKKIDCKKTSYLFATPYEDCIKRDMVRERSVGEQVIKNMYMNFYIPQRYEGFDDIKIIWNYEKSDFNIVKCLMELDDIDHGNPHHSLSIGKHLDKCADELGKMINNDMEHELLRTAAQSHDLGKKFVKTYNPDKGYFTYYQHHLVGAYDSMFYLKNSGYPESEILEVANLIQWHMQLYFLESEKSKEKFKKLVGEKTYSELVLLNDADMLAK